MKNTQFSICTFSIEGFRNMTSSYALIFIIFVKNYVILFIPKLFFFPNFLGNLPTDAVKVKFVNNEFIRRALLLKS